MSEKLITPDLGFVRDVILSGGESLKKCYQCATCSVVCNITPEDNPFPRKEMVNAQWGLKDELFSNPDIWLCHQCSDCTALCPRGAKPGEVLGAVRKMSIERYSKPAFIARMVGDPKWLVPLIGVPVILFLFMLKMVGNIPFINTLDKSGGEIVFSEFVPLLPYLDGTFIVAFSFALAVLALGVLSYWKDLSRSAKPEGSLISGIMGAIGDILAHRKFGECDVASGRKIAHMLVFFGFVLLFIATVFAGFYEWVMKLHGPYPFTDPIKWFGNAGAIALTVGFVMVVINRLQMAAKTGKTGIGGYYDWLFLGIVATVGATGILSQFIRLAEMANLAYTMYFMHLVSIFFLFTYAPYTKMAHMVYRTTAMVFANMTGRK